MSNEKLKVPGRMLQIFNKLEHFASCLLEEDRLQVYHSAFLSAEYYDEIVLSKTCLSDHSPEKYEESLRLILQNYF